MHRPKSMLGLIIAGFILVASPLIAAVIGSFVGVRDISARGERVVGRAVDITRLSQDLSEQIVGIERNARQYSVLGDKELLTLQRTRQTRLDETVAKLEALTRRWNDSSHLDRIRSYSHEVLLLLQTGGELPPADPESVFDRLQRATGEWLEHSRTLIFTEFEAVRRGAQDARRRVLWLVLTTGLAALAMILLFTGLIARPVRQLGGAIHVLQSGDLDRPVRVRGPEDLAALGEALESLRLRLKSAEEDKQSFLQHMSHELKTPLAGLLEGTELLTDGSMDPLSPAQSEVAGILRTNSQELRHLIENLLDFNAWQDEHASLEFTRFDFRELCRQVIEQQRIAVLGKSLRVALRCMPIRIDADRPKMRIILSNLLSNAVKYAPVDSEVQLRAAARDGRLIFDIADAGPDVPADERARIFEPFFSGTPPSKSHLRGTGIGLSLVREYVHAHGGTIGLMQGTFKGAHFRMTLPLEQGERADPGLHPAARKKEDSNA